MAHLSKQERQIGIKTSPDKFYSFFRDNMPSFPRMFQSYVKSFELVGGGTEIKSGSILAGHIALIDGSPVMGMKGKLEAVDDARKTMIYDVVEGDVLKMYKSFKSKLEVTADCVKWTLEYEKANNNTPDPDVCLDMAAKLSKGIDAHLSK